MVDVEAAEKAGYERRHRTRCGPWWRSCSARRKAGGWQNGFPAWGNRAQIERRPRL
jgi:hypothetical protein